jgi:hypothetical protein
MTTFLRTLCGPCVATLVALAAAGCGVAADAVGSQQGGPTVGPVDQDDLPHRLFRALLSTPVEPQEMPAGFAAGDKDSPPGGDFPRMRGAIGRVRVQIDGPVYGYQINYDVYVSTDHALYDFEHAVNGPGSVVLNEAVPVSELDHRSNCGNYSTTLDDPVTRQSRTIGTSSCTILVDNVQVRVFSLSLTDPRQGDMSRTVELGQAAVAHLLRIQAQVR